MNHAAIIGVISMYHKLVYMLAAVCLTIKSESSIRIMKALAHTHQKPRTSFICEDVLLVQSRVTNRNQEIKKKKDKSGFTGRNSMTFILLSRSLSVHSGPVSFSMILQ